MQPNYWKNPNNGRYYVAAPIKDLLGHYTIAVANGGEKKKLTRYRAVYASEIKNENEEKETLEMINKTREHHGYIECYN